jgi:NADH:ubiquinone oxidoreductase subunit E
VKAVGEIIADFPRTPESLIPILQEIQEEYNFLSEDSIKDVASELTMPLHHVYSVATFYNVFSLKPKGQNIVKVCMGSACHVRGAVRIMEEIERSLSIKSGETSTDGKFSLESVNCLGACALGPIMVLNKEYNGHITPAKVEKIFQEFNSK